MKKKAPTKTKEDKKDKKPKLSELETLLTTLKPSMIRFVYLYLGAEDGSGFNNATISYIKAYDIETSLRRDSQGKYSKEYLTSKTSGYELLTKPDIQRLKHLILLESGFNPESIKKRFTELGYQNKNLIVAHNAIRDVAKISGVMKEDSKVVDIPQLQQLTEDIKKILTPKK